MKRLLLFLMIFGLLAALGVGFIGFLHPAFDTIANFRAHLSIVLIFFAVIWLFSYGLIIGFLLIICAFAGIFFSLWNPDPYQWPTNDNSSPGKSYSLLHLNLLYENDTPEKVVDLVAQTNADILTFNEVSDEWKNRLAYLQLSYPFVYYCPEWSTIGGSIIYSRFPTTTKPGYCHSYGALALKDVIIEDKVFTIGAVHLRWPWPASGPRQVDNLKPELNRLGPSALIVGDYNSTNWTWLLRRFAQYGNLKIIDGIGPSWIQKNLPTWMAKYIGFPIDNAMVKGNFIIRNIYSLPPVGSDHLPVLIRFSIF